MNHILKLRITILDIEPEICTPQELMGGELNEE